MTRDSRNERVEQLAREVLGEAIASLKDPRIGFITVTGVKVSPDLRHARVFVSALGSPEQRQASMEAIQNAGSHLRSVLGSEVRMKYLPRLEFIEDTTAEHGARIETLLREIGVSEAPKVEELEGKEGAEE